MIGSISSSPRPGNRLYAVVSVGGRAEEEWSGGGDGGKQGLRQGSPDRNYTMQWYVSVTCLGLLKQFAYNGP
jgi:hypothetical protein